MDEGHAGLSPMTIKSLRTSNSARAKALSLQLHQNTNTLAPHRASNHSKISTTTGPPCCKPQESTGEVKVPPTTNLSNHLHRQTPSPHPLKGSMIEIWNIPDIRGEEHQGEGGGLANRKRNKKMKTEVPKMTLSSMSTTRTKGEKDSSHQGSPDFEGMTKRKTKASKLHNNPSLHFLPPSTTFNFTTRTERGELG
uniref:Uncharacterized protein n=1 Tax=Oryza punctata TaxID=4537 RepID=A0A0E0M6H8_ORYPU